MVMMVIFGEGREGIKAAGVRTRAKLTSTRQESRRVESSQTVICSSMFLFRSGLILTVLILTWRQRQRRERERLKRAYCRTNRVPVESSTAERKVQRVVVFGNGGEEGSGGLWPAAARCDRWPPPPDPTARDAR